MLIGIGCTVPEIVNLPGQSGGVDVALDYSLASACNNNSAFSPSQATPSGGVFSATPSGLNINSSTGEVTPIGSTPQAYVIAYTVSGSTSTFDLTIKPLDNATFSYSASSFPQDGSDPSPVFTSETITGGTFSATPSGLSINTSTGEINLSASTIGSYTITYNTASSGSSVCPNTSNVTLAVGAASLAQVSNVYSMEFDGGGDFINAGTGLGDMLGSSVTNFSVSGWFKTSLSPLPSNEGMFAFGDHTSSVSNSPFHFYQSSYNRFFVFFGGGVYHRYSVDVYTGGARWINYIISYDGTQSASPDRLKLYIDGVFLAPNVTGSTMPTSINLTNNTNTIGVSATNKFYNGKIDEVAIFNYSLTPAEALSIYNATEIVSGVSKTADLSQLTTPPVKWYRMGD